ncbi:MAG: hypothetical protein MJB57_07100 [Gemmatimonadetes bacterium]|nr:hypothetical protein [Gemmatimonadota bacterium]
MIDPITGVTDAPVDLFTNEAPGGNLGKDEFMELLIAQLQNQDPLSPMEADQLAVQLAQFASVEQLIEINDNIQSLGATDGILAGSVATSTAVGLIGKNVRAAVSEITFDGSGSASIDITAPPSSGPVVVHFFDATGTEVASYDAGTLEPGDHTIDLEKVDESLPPGTYDITIDTTDAVGNSISIAPTIFGYVTGVRYDQTGPVLAVGLTEFPLSAVLEVSE